MKPPGTVGECVNQLVSKQEEWWCTGALVLEDSVAEDAGQCPASVATLFLCVCVCSDMRIGSNSSKCDSCLLLWMQMDG